MAQALLAEPPAAAINLRTSDARRRRETRMRWLFKAAAIFTFAISIAILYILIKDAFGFFIDVPKASLWGIGWFPRRGTFDLLTLFYGSLIVGLIAMLVAAPIGLGSAVYLSEYAHPRVRRVLKPTLELLASMPSVVLGYFAISFINPESRRALRPIGQPRVHAARGRTGGWVADDPPGRLGRGGRAAGGAT